MKFKVLKGTPLFKQLTAVKKEMVRCNDAAYEIIKEFGCTQMRGKFGVIAGGISGIIFQNGKKPPEGWRYTGESFNEYMPKKNVSANKELNKRIKELPIVEYDALNDPLNFDWHDNDGSRKVSFHPGIKWKNNYILIDVSKHYPRYKPQEGMIEILESEYNKLAEEKKKKKEPAMA